MSDIYVTNPPETAATITKTIYNFSQHLLDNEPAVRQIENIKDILYVTNGVNRMNAVDKT